MKIKLALCSTIVLALIALTGCPPSSQPQQPSQTQPLPPLPRCEVLLQAHPDGSQKWWTAVRDGDNIKLCAVFYTGTSNQQCLIEPAPTPEDQEGQEQSMWASADDSCLGPSVQYMQCEQRNCEDIFNILARRQRCTTAVHARRSGECNQLWVRNE